MSLSYDILRFGARALTDPQFASDPNVWKRLMKEARDAFEGIVALHAPMSPLTYESSALLQGSVQASNRIPFRFPWPVEIVGFFPTLVTPVTEDGITPGIDDIRVQIDIDSNNYMTSGDGLSIPGNPGGTPGPFVTLSAMSVLVPRLVGYKLRTATPDIGFTYAWKQAAGTYSTTMISMAIFARKLGG